MPWLARTRRYSRCVGPAGTADGTASQPSAASSAEHQVEARRGAVWLARPFSGVWAGTASARTFDVHDPSTLERLVSLPDMDASDTAKSVEAAHASLPAWRSTTARHRANILKRWHRSLLDNRESLAYTMTLESGKPLAESRGEVDYGASYLEWFAEEASRITGDILPSTSSGRRLLVTKHPVGVCALITPWNFPLAMIARKVAPALAAGCTVVVKPASQTPLTCLLMAKLGLEAGLPDSVVNIVTASHANTASVGKVLAEHRLVRKISFTGSTAVGKLLAAQATSTMKRVSLELGGNAPLIVFEDADLDLAVNGIMASKFRNAGQTCICTNRIYAHKDIAATLISKLRARIAALRVGSGLHPDTQIGPLISQAAMAKVERHVSDALESGAVAGPLFWKPTLLSGVTGSMLIAREETFGPVAAVLEFASEPEAIELANATDAGLAAYFYTRDLSRVVRVADALQVGMVGINEAMISTEVAPFGGIKDSGVGREGSQYGINEYLDIKYLCLGGIQESASP
ncbi:succinate-semialdehyde dehydrogenase I [Entophlyctis helioformis]|nr:succinate-semialdehyde dehydrogenase I [Entophlyctis helioformis]